jgi:hypothetical protein
MGVLSFLRNATRPAARPAAAPAPSAPTRRSPDASLERLEAQFGAEVAPAAKRLREAVEWHRTGRKADAWVAFELLLSDPEMGGSAQLRPGLESEVYARMRVCYEREGCFNPALTPAALSYAARAKFFAVHGRDAELAALRSPAFFEKLFMPLLERARLQSAMPRFRMLVEDQLRAVPMVDLHTLREKIEYFRLNPPQSA